MAHAGTVVILAAGQGTRMKSARPKVLHELCGRPMLGYVLDQARCLEPERIVLVVGSSADEVEAWVRAEETDLTNLSVVRQEPQLGTGHAVQVALEAIGGGDLGTLVVLYGDMPLLTAETLQELVSERDEIGDTGVALLTALLDDPRGYGRVLRSEDSRFARIVEDKDATLEEREVAEVNVGVYAFPGARLAEVLPRLSSENAQGEYYLTDAVGLLAQAGSTVAALPLEEPDEALGVNSLAQLAEVREHIQHRILQQHLDAGVFIEDPATCFVDHGVEIGAGTRILPCTVVRRGVVIGRDCEVGPFTHLRVGTTLEDRAEVGNFTEAKKARIGSGTKAKHLTYLGDVEIGAGTNIGAGTIVANYDGRHKHKTIIGARAFVGSGAILIAPNTIGDGALIGGGAVVTRDSQVGPGEAWVGVPARRLRSSEPTGAQED